ncbi:MAG: glycoside hydrolase family 15 protein [Solirubrobacterales bacterium]|nr:glycoside hydrolase family 15 protein [Solirubrobacterales bacterium]MBV9717344.1 glycoside hydrolase family 15 protein [Solirubrobacterales bacterium]
MKGASEHGFRGAYDDGIRRTAFPPIADYAFLSDCVSTALVASNGNVEWMCLPRMDSPSVFAAMLDRDAGSFRLGPADVSVPAGRRYIPGTMVLETSWETRMGWVIVRDALSIGPWRHETERSRSHRRSPTDHDADQVMLRLIECVQGSAEIKLECEPAFDYGGLAADWEYAGPGYCEAIARSEGIDLQLRLTTDLRLGFEGPRARARTTLHEGQRAFVALGWSTHGMPTTYEEAEAWLQRTGRFWQEWLKHGAFPDHAWRSYLQRSALTLKGLTYAPSGAMLAAATTSLPETPGGDRNWDYRYSWIRDSTFMLWALYTLGFDEEANDFFYFVEDMAEAEEGQLQIMYGIGGESRLEEQELEHLSGYEQSRPVRVGNGAYNQDQHDVWGAVLDSIYLHTRSRDQLPDRLWPIIKRQVETALARWREPDRGIWEVRGDPKHFTSSKVMCWVAADRGARLAELRADELTSARWQAAADEIHADICANGVDQRGVFVQHYDTDALDASLLLMPLVRFLPPDDPRLRATVLAIADELTENDLVLRYRVDKTDDGFASEEGTFTICSFWLVSALVEIGELGRARALCEKLLSFASPLQLYAEEVDAATGRHLGNFPQAFTHLALINAVVHIIRAEAQLELQAPARTTALEGISPTS